MSMQNYVDALREIEKNSSKAFFVGSRSEELVCAAEKRLNVVYPPTYRRFLQLLGAGNFGSAEFYGIIDENFDNSSVPNGVWCTLSERSAVGLPDRLVVIGNTGDGSLYCIDTVKAPEGPVIIYQPGLTASEQSEEVVAEDFGEFFFKQIQARL